MINMFRYEFPAEFIFAAILLPSLYNKTEDQKSKTEIVRRLKLGLTFAFDCIQDYVMVEKWSLILYFLLLFYKSFV